MCKTDMPIFPHTFKGVGVLSAAFITSQLKLHQWGLSLQFLDTYVPFSVCCMYPGGIRNTELWRWSSQVGRRDNVNDAGVAPRQMLTHRVRVASGDAAAISVKH